MRPLCAITGCGLPVLKLVVLFSLASGALLDVVIGNLHSHDLRLFHRLWECLQAGDILLVDALPEPDRVVFSMALGDVPPDQRLEVFETVLRFNAWLATQDEVVSSIVLSGQQIVLKGQQRIEGLDRDALRRTVLDIQGAALAWWYFLQTRERPEEAVVLDARFERV